jgi:two-component system KDP operon response regulator KdpE
VLSLNWDPRGHRILACDGSLQVARALRVVLRYEGYEVVTVATPEEAWRTVSLSAVDAAIVDLRLPNDGGIQLCRRLREVSDMPILMLAGSEDIEQTVRALRAGADDCVAKPFSPRELVARLEAVLRRTYELPAENVIRGGGLEIDLPGRTIRRDGRMIHLTRKEFDLLQALVGNRGRVLTHRVLLSEVWGAEYAEDTPLLRTNIARLRRKLDGGAGKYIQTEPGVGFRFNLPG